jgi:tetraacyldisaccharide 4'-kinase
VGNLVVGGTGKTPVTKWIARVLAGAGLSPAVISRGYGGERKGPEAVVPGAGAARLYGDEPVMLALEQPGVPVVVGRDRWKAGVEAAKNCGAKVLVADDAFQHRRLGRDLDIVVVDAARLFGNGRIFPGGPLREPVASLARADVVFLTRVAAAGEALAERRALLASLAPAAVFVETDIIPSRWRHFGPDMEASGPPEGGVFAFCGLANPGDFNRTLEEAGCLISGGRSYPDHHRYGRGDMESLARAADRSGAAAAVTTAKDAVRIESWPGRLPLLVLDVELKFVTGEVRFREMIHAAGRGRSL